MSKKPVPGLMSGHPLTALPPSWLLEAMKLTEGALRERVSGLDIVFDSEFAPSHSIAYVDGQKTEIAINARTRPVLYNHHVLDNLQDAINICVKLGLPWLLCGLPLQFEQISERDLKVIMPKAGDLAETLSEGGPEWLAVVCYMNWVLACHLSTIESPAYAVAHHVFLAGATARELELAILNREHAARGRKTVESADKGAQATRAITRLRTDPRYEEMKRLVPKHGVLNAARLLAKRRMGSASANKGLWYRRQKK